MSEHEAGRALDALVAEKVMGYWDVGMYEGRLVHGEHNMNGWPMDTPHYSTDIAAAWLVVDALTARSIYICVEWVSGTRGGKAGWNAWAGNRHVYATTAPLAVCRAALATLGSPR